MVVQNIHLFTTGITGSVPLFKTYMLESEL